MFIPRDKVLHLLLGTSWAVVTLLVFFIALQFGIGAAMAASTTAYGVTYEINQWYRKEGTPELWDAVATAVPGFLAWLVWEIK